MLCTAGSGWYQEEEKEPVSLEPQFHQRSKIGMVQNRIHGSATLQLRYPVRSAKMSGVSQFLIKSAVC